MAAAKLTDTMICWTPVTGWTPNPAPTRVDPRPRGGRAAPGRSRPLTAYAFTDGACHGYVEHFSKAQRVQYLLGIALKLIIRDGLDPAPVHAVLRRFPEYRDALPEDMP